MGPEKLHRTDTEEMNNTTNQQFHNYYNQGQPISDFTQNQGFTHAFFNKNGNMGQVNERPRQSHKTNDRESIKSNKNLKGNTSQSSNLNIKEEQYMKNASKNNPVGWTMSPIFELKRSKLQNSESRTRSAISPQRVFSNKKGMTFNEFASLKEEKKKILELKEQAEYCLDIAAMNENSQNKPYTTPVNKPQM